MAACEGATAQVGQFSDIPTLKGLECVFGNVLSVALGLSGIVVFVMFVIGGFRYLTSGGDQKAVEAARGTLTYAIGGLVVFVFAFVILLVISAITGTNLTIFQIIPGK